MEQLRQLAMEVERQRKLQSMEKDLLQQQQELERKVWNLKYDWEKEQRDVDKLHEFSLTGLLYDLLGKKVEKLEQEQREALAAAAKYQAAAAELNGVCRELEGARSELQTLMGCELRYKQAKEARAAQLKAEDPVVGPELEALEEELARISSQRRELQEAMTAGNRALQTARDVQTELDGAENWGTWDMLGGGGLLTQMAKHDHLDSAQMHVNSLQNQLRQFRTELADVNIQAQMSVQVDEFLRFADWFFDGLIVDWTVQNKIRDAQNQMYRVTAQIQQLLDRLASRQTALIRRETEARARMDALVLPR